MFYYLFRSQMKKCYTLVAGLLLLRSAMLFSQIYLDPAEGLRVAYLSPVQGTVQTCDFGLLNAYYCTGDTVYQVSLADGQVKEKYAVPADYEPDHFPSFLNVAPDGLSLWVGYTDMANVDCRIYQVDLTDGSWKLSARMAAHFDLAFWNDSLLVSGLNSDDIMNAQNGIFLLDTTGSDQHRKIVETGGSSAGLAVDSMGNLYYATSFFAVPNALYRWDSAQLAAVVETPGVPVLGLDDAEKLSDLPMGAYDCEVDAGGNVAFSMNVWGGTQVLAAWNGTTGDGANYDTLAVSEQWLGLVRSWGDYTVDKIGNSLLVTSYGMPLGDVHTVNYPPQLTGLVPDITGFEGEQMSLDLGSYVVDRDDHKGFEFSIDLMSVPEVAALSMEDSSLMVTFGRAGQSNLLITATSGGQNLVLSSLVGSWPVLEGDFLMADFEDLPLEPESYWNGSDSSGQFVSGPVRFHNAYTNFGGGFYAWSGWSYSNTTDASTSGVANQFSVITGGGFPDEQGKEGNYGVASLYGPSVLEFPDKAHAVQGCYITNSTYAALSMEKGDMFARKFGGEDDTDPDYLKLMTWGRKEGSSTDTLEFMLADYRFDDKRKDYIVRTWQWMDLSALGKVDSLMFGLASSDVGDWGINTPAYFCMDHMHVISDAPPFVAHPIPDQELYQVPGTLVINVSQVFSDPDDDDANIILSLPENDEHPPLGVVLDGSSLVLTNLCQLVKSAISEVQVVLEGSLGGLSARDSFMVRLECVNGIEDSNSLTVGVYPNPSTGSFRVEAPGMNESHIMIYNLMGTLVHEEILYQMGEWIDLGGQPTGSYFLRVVTEGKTGSKLIQKR
jgi:hypothetical protein